MIALRGAIHVACFHHSCFLTGSYRCLTKTWMHEDTPHLFLCGKEVVEEYAEKKSQGLGK